MCIFIAGILTEIVPPYAFYLDSAIQRLESLIRCINSILNYLVCLPMRSRLLV